MENSSAPRKTNGKNGLLKDMLIRVLCVDDETSFLNSAKQILEMEGTFQVETASSVNEALQKMKGTEFDVVVSDYMMPEKNGLDFLRELRENDNEIPFILFTGQGREEVAIKALNLGADRYFNKFGHPETVYGELAYGLRQCIAQRNAEKQIWDREERLRAIIGSSPDAMIITDLKGNITDCNVETLKLLEVPSKQDLIGINCSTLVAVSEREKMKATSIKLLNEGAVHNIQCVFLTKKGNEVPTEYSASILRDAYGKTIGSVILASDISERKKAEAELLQSESRFRDFFDHSPVYCYILSLDGKIIEVNKSALTSLGYTKEELLGKPIISTMCAPSSRRKAKKLLEKNKSGEDFEDEEIEILTKKGKKRTVIVRGQCAIDVHGKIMYFVSVQRDITEEKKAEEAIKKSEEKYRGIVELSPDGIATMDMKGIVTSVNKAFLDLTGFSEEEIVGKHFTKLGTIKLKDIPKYVKLVSDILRGKKIGATEFDYYQKNGTHRLGEARVSLLKVKGKTVGLQAFLTDITERKRIDQKLKESEEKFRSAFEQAQDAMFTFDLTGVITSCNAVGLLVTGFSEEEIVGKHYTDLAPMRGLDNKQFLGTFTSIVDGKIPDPFEISYFVKGKQRFGEIQVSFIKKGKKITGFQAIMRDTTEKRKVEAAIRISEEKYRSIVELSPDGILSLDANGIITQVNRAIVNQTGFSEEEFLGKHFTELKVVQSENLPEFTKQIETFLTGKIPTSVFEFAYYFKDGTKRIAEASIGLLNQKDQNAGIQLILRDVTERKKTEEALRESEKRFRELSEMLPEVIFEADLNANVTFVNQEAYNKFGYTKEEFEKFTSSIEILAPEDRELSKKNLARILSGETLGSREYTAVRKDGTTFPIIVNSTPIVRDGKVVGFRGLMVDITERKKTQEAIKQSEKRFRELSEMLPVGVFEVDANGKVTFVNQKIYSKLGYSTEEFEKAFTTLQMIKPEDRDAIKKNVVNLMSGKATNPQEYTVIRKDGTTVPVMTNSNPIFRDGKVAGFRGVLVDITERKTIENTLKESEEKFRTLAEQSPNMIFINQDGKIVYVNPKCEEMGYTKEEFYSPDFNFLDLIAQDYVELIVSNFSKHKKGEDVPPAEYSIVTKKGKRIEAILTTKLILYKGKNAILGTITDITEHKKTEKALRESEKRFRELSEMLPVIIFELDSNGKLTFVNREAYRKYGYSKEEFEKAINTLQAVVPEQQDRLKKSMAKLLSGEATNPQEYNVVKKDGTTLPVITHAAPIFRDNKVVGFRGISLDITELKKTQEAIKQSEKRFRELSEMLPEVVFETDENAKLTFVNRESYSKFGYTKEDFLKGLSTIQFIAPEDRERAKKNLAKLMSGEKTGPSEYLGIRKDGTRFPISVSSSPIIHDGKVVGYRGLLVDITERKKAEEAIKQSEKRFRELSEMLPEVIFEADLNGRVTFVNRESYSKFGYTKEDYEKGMSATEFLVPEDRERSKKNLRKAGTDERVGPKEYIALRKDGTRFPISVSSSPIIHDGKVVGYRGIMVDVSEHMKAENKLKQTLTNLERLNEKLSVIGKLARHDARNKLAAISNSAFLIRSKIENNPKLMEQLKDIEVSVEQIEKIFDFARFYEMLGTQELTDIKVQNSLEEAFMLASHSDDIELVNECEGLTVRADSLLRQIFYNLIDNSQKYGEKVTQIRVYYKQNKNNLKLVYEDNGVGIQEDEKEVIFKEGYGKGTGYGLYLIKKICEEYGWTIKETSKHGKGAQFTITIPKLDKNGKNNYTTKSS